MAQWVPEVLAQERNGVGQTDWCWQKGQCLDASLVRQNFANCPYLAIRGSYTACSHLAPAATASKRGRKNAFDTGAVVRVMYSDAGTYDLGSKQNFERNHIKLFSARDRAAMSVEKNVRTSFGTIQLSQCLATSYCTQH
jgi:hypothetical protein